MSRSGNDAFAQLVRKHQTRDEKWSGAILKIGYANYRLKVRGRVYGIKTVRVDRSTVDLGTADRPKVFVGDIARIERIDGKWICTRIVGKQQFCPATAEDSDVEVNIDSVSSWSVQNYGANLTPLDPTIPFFEPLGNIALPDGMFPSPTTFLCGIPQCTDCAPDGFVSGMSPVLSTDAEHPTGCWQWGFKCRGCSATGTPVFRSTFIYDTNSARHCIAFIPEPCAPYVYALASSVNLVDQEGNIIPDNGTSYTIDVTNPDTPSIFYSSDYKANTINDLNMLFIPSTSPYNIGGGWAIEPHKNFGSGSVVTAVEGSFRSITAIGRNFQVGSHLASQGFIYDADTPTPYDFQWIEMYNVGGDTIGTYIPVSITNMFNVSNFPISPTLGAGLAILYGTIATRYFFLASSPYVMFTYHDGFVYAANTLGNLDVIDFSNPASTSLTTTLGGACTYAQAMQANGNTLWIADGSTNELIGIDITNPASPSVISTTSLSDKPQGIGVCDNYVYLALDNGDVVGYNISTPASPTLSGTDTIPDFTPSQKMLKLAQDKIYVLGYTTSTNQPTLATLDA